MTSEESSADWREAFRQAAQRFLHDAEADCARQRAEALREGARSAAESLNVFIRGLRHANAESEILSHLVSSSTPYCDLAASLVLDGAQVHVADARGFTAPAQAFDAATAAAIASVLETKDPVISQATETELSPVLFDAAFRGRESAGERVYLFPLATAGVMGSFLMGAGQVQPAPLELLAEMAALRLELLEAHERERQHAREMRQARERPPAAEPLLTVSSATPSRAWDQLTPQQQSIHLRAQRFARVRVAEVRLGKVDAVREGQQRGDIYSALRQDIDAARDAYRKEFGESAGAMVDYLYLELVRSLANGDDRLLGPNFPGRLF